MWRSVPEDDDGEVGKHSNKGQAREVLVASDLSKEHTSGHEDDHAGHEADALAAALTARHLRDTLALPKNERTYGQNHLNSEGNVDGVAGSRAEETEEDVAVGSKREAIGVEAEEGLPHDEGRAGGR